MSKIINTIEGIETELKSPKFSKKDIFIANTIFNPLSEILESVENINLILAFINSFPYNNKNITRYNYFRYHLENYLNEIYILKNRLISYLKIIIRSYNKNTKYKNIDQNLNPLYGMINNSFKGLVNIRGSHVHVSRYSHFDLDRLRTIEIFTKSEDKLAETFLEMQKIILSEVRSKWKTKIKKDLESINKLLDIYFERIMKEIIGKNKLLIPF